MIWLLDPFILGQSPPFPQIKDIIYIHSNLRGLITDTFTLVYRLEVLTLKE